MFGLGFGEILLLAAIGLIVLGPKQMPQVARLIGRTLAELRKALSEVTKAVSVELDDDRKGPQAGVKPTIEPKHNDKPSTISELLSNAAENPTKPPTTGKKEES